MPQSLLEASGITKSYAAFRHRSIEPVPRIAALKNSGAGIVYISHRLEEISAIADRITVLRDGESIGTSDAAAVNREQLIAMMVGREVAAVYPKRAVPAGKVALELHGIGTGQVSLSVRQGEIPGIAGLVGSGRTELAETIFGLTPPDSGEIFVDGSAVRIESPAIAIAHGIGYVPEDRRQHLRLTETSARGYQEKYHGESHMPR